MKSLVCFTALTFLTLVPSAFAASYGSLDPVGTWLTEDGRAKVHIDKCGADHKEICGTIVWLKEPLDEKGHPKTDVKNPDPAKRSRTTLGMQLVSELQPDEDQVYSGQIYNAENGKNYDVTFHVEKPTDLHVKGCMLAVLCGSQHWTRVDDMPSTVVATSQTKMKKAAVPVQ